MKPIDPSLMIGLATTPGIMPTSGIPGHSALKGKQAATVPDMQKAATEFESYFLASLMGEMRKSIPQGGLFGGGPGQDIYQSLFDQALGQALAQKGGLGLAKQIVQHYVKKEQNGAQELHKINR